MTSHMIDLVRNVVWYADIKGPILEIGSYIEDNQEHLDLRKAFPRGTPYTGVDVNEGPGVDRKVDLLNPEQMHAILYEVAPKAVFCLYVIEHVWDIKAAANALATLWLRNQESWLWIATHQSQPFHGTSNYGDFWRLTLPGLARLMDEAGVPGSQILALDNSSNPSDVLMVRQPASMPWPDEAFDLSARSTMASQPSSWCRHR